MPIWVILIAICEEHEIDWIKAKQFEDTHPGYADGQVACDCILA